jgi:GxxExxY protein
MAEPIGAVRDPQTYSIIGAAMEVHRVFGCGFLEAPYSRALKVELRLRGIPFEAEMSFPLSYKGQSLALAYRPDLICFGSIIVEVKALPTLGGFQFAQAINYLRASGLRRALVLNFGARSLGYKRLVFGPDPSVVSDP